MDPCFIGAIALLYPPRVRVRATVKLSAAFFHDESSITIGGYESAIEPFYLGVGLTWTKLKKLHLSLKLINSPNIW